MSESSDLRGEIDTTYHTQQRDMFASGLAASIGVNAFGVWSAIKAHAALGTGESWPSIRKLIELTGLSTVTVQKALRTLQDYHLLRANKSHGKKTGYIARERMDVRVGNRVLCTIVIDYVPVQMRERLEKLKKAVAGGDFVDDDVWLNVDILPGPGLTFDPETKTLRGLMRADELPGGAPVKSVSEAKKTMSLLAGRLPKN